jgi:hypothetical protein
MPDDLRQILRRNKTSLAAHLAAALSRGSASRFQKIDPQLLSERCGMLVEALISSAWQGSDQLAQRMAMIARRRLAEGLLLEDLQRALRILEVDAWRVIVGQSRPESVVSNLSLLNVAMGYARDELAHIAQLHAFAAAS